MRLSCPAAGSLFRNPALADSLEELAASGCASFYRGPLAERIAAAARAGGSRLTAEDLAAHQADWVAPLARGYAGHTVHELPPNGQGIAVPIALGIFEAAGGRRLAPGSPEATHLAIEAMKLAMGDLGRAVADPAHMDEHPRALLAPERLEALAARIRPAAALPLETPPPGPGGTVYLSAADREGMAVSYIQSNYLGFGSGVVVPGTGIALHNRGLGFSLEPGHPNRVAGGKRPFHTLIPGFLSRGGRAAMAFGLMGGGMQPQGQMQLLLHILDGGLDPQAAIDAPRWYVQPDGSVGVEDAFPPALAEALDARGHRIRRDVPAWTYGGAQAAWALKDGWLGASDRRKDGLALAL